MTLPAPSRPAGRFIVIEGIDGSGTTTQAELLARRLVKEKKVARVTAEPSDGPVGALIRQVLSGRIVGAGGLAPGWQTMALLFAADRMDHVEAEIEPFLAAGGIVISDRYDASSLAYQSVMSGHGGAGAVEWIRTLNRYARRPDLTIVLDVPPELAATRREARGEAAQLYEQNEIQIALSHFYKDLDKHLPNDRVILIDGSKSVEAVADAVYAAYASG
jgi:dTMP kinase